MNAEELSYKMISSFFTITTGIVVSMYVFCLIFYPNAHLTLSDIGRILLMAASSDLTQVVYFSPKELDKKQIQIRMALHIVLLEAVLLYFASSWGWVLISSVGQVTVFLLAVLIVYIAIVFFNRKRDSKLSDQLNDRLKQRYKE